MQQIQCLFNWPTYLALLEVRANSQEKTCYDCCSSSDTLSVTKLTLSKLQI